MRLDTRLGFAMLTTAFCLANQVERSLVSIMNDDESSSSSSSEYDLSRCVDRVVNRRFASSGGIVAIFIAGSKNRVEESTRNDGVPRLLVDFSKPRSLAPHWLPKEVRYAVIYLDGDFPRDIRTLDYLRNFHPRSRLLIALILPDNGSLSADNYLVKLVDRLGKDRRLFVDFAVASVGRKVALYGYSETVYGRCGEATLLRFGDCERERNVADAYHGVNYNLCPLRLATFDWPPMTRFVFENGRKLSVGVESNIVNIIVERLNASTDFLDIPPSEIRESLAEGTSDIGWGQMSLYETDEYTYTKSYIFAYGIIILPKSSSAFQLTMNNLMPLGKTVWIALMMVFLSALVLRRVLPTFKFVTMLDTFGLCLGLGVATRPRRLPHRVYFVSWAFFGYVISQAYLANLTLVFTKPGDQRTVDSLEELEKSTIPFGGPAVMRGLFRDKYPRLYAEYKEMNLTEFRENLMRLKTRREGCPTYVEASRYVSYDNWKNVFALPDKINSFPLGMVVQNVSVSLETSDHVITRVLEAGLMSYWAEIETRKNRKDFDHIREDSDGGEEDLTGLQKFFTIFQLLVIAMSISVIVFLAEIIISTFST